MCSESHDDGDGTASDIEGADADGDQRATAEDELEAARERQELLARELARQNRTVCRTTGLSPDDACAKAQAEARSVLRSCPDPSLLDLHLALHLGRRVNADHQVDFLGRSWPISATTRRTVTLIHHPHRQFWVVSQPPNPPQNRCPDILGKFSL